MYSRNNKTKAKYVDDVEVSESECGDVFMQQAPVEVV